MEEIITVNTGDITDEVVFESDTHTTPAPQKRGRGRMPKSTEVDLRIVEVDGEKIITRPSQIKERLLDYMGMADVSVKDLANKMGLSYQSLNKKLNNHVSFTLDEIQVIRHVLSIGPDEIVWIFCLGDR